jgi:hypothetical protein
MFLILGGSLIVYIFNLFKFNMLCLFFYDPRKCSIYNISAFAECRLLPPNN